MNIHIATCGEQTEHVISCVKAIPEALDKIYILSSEKFVYEGNLVVKRLQTMGYDCKLIFIDGFDYQEVVTKIYQICGENRNDNKKVKFSINITGGTNLMAAAACSASLFTGATVYYIRFDPNNINQPLSERLVTIAMPKIPDKSEFGETTKTVVSYICKETRNGEPVTNVEIASSLGMSPAKLGHHLKLLSSKKMIEHYSPEENRRIMYNKITREGEMFVDWWL